jgi:hypothetical protein
MYVVQIAHESPMYGYWMHLIEIYLWAVYVHRYPLAGARRVGFGLSRGWPFVFVCAGIISSFPGQDSFGARVDKWSFPQAGVRARHYVIEALFLLAFVTIPTLGAEHTVITPKLMGKHLPWLNWWSLLAFCYHKAVYYLIGGQPWGISVVFGSALPFYALWLACTGSGRSERNDARHTSEVVDCCSDGEDIEERNDAQAKNDAVSAPLAMEIGRAGGECATPEDEKGEHGQDDVEMW